MTRKEAAEAFLPYSCSTKVNQVFSRAEVAYLPTQNSTSAKMQQLHL